MYADVIHCGRCNVNRLASQRRCGRTNRNRCRWRSIGWNAEIELTLLEEMKGALLGNLHVVNGGPKLLNVELFASRREFFGYLLLVLFCASFAGEIGVILDGDQ